MNRAVSSTSTGRSWNLSSRATAPVAEPDLAGDAPALQLWGRPLRCSAEVINFNHADAVAAIVPCQDGGECAGREGKSLTP